MILEKIETEAEKVLQTVGVKGMPVPIEDIASNLNIKISRSPSKDFSGLLVRKDGHALIGINSDEPMVRQRFTVAHEIGHFVLHPQKDAFVDYRDNKDGKKEKVMRTPREREADMFAAALLMPRSFIEKDFQGYAKVGFSETDLSALAEKYDVSEDAMRFRLINLNLQRAAV